MSTLILGGGITGLLAAWHLHQRGEDVTVWEADETVGGWVQTLPWPDEKGRPGRIEKGPQGILTRAGSAAERLFQALELPLESPGKGARWVGKGDRLIPVPAHPIGLVASPLMGWGTKFRMFLEPFIPVGPEEPEEGLADFIARRAGRGVADELLPAMVAGILAAPPHRLSVDALPTLRKWESHGSLVAGVRKSGISHLMVPRGGMGALTQRLAERLPAVHTSARAQSLSRLDSGQWRVQRAGESRDVDRVLLALPAHEAALLLRPVANASAEALDAIPYTHLSLWHSRHQPVAPYADGFGFLIDPPSGRPYLGTLVPSWIDKDCAPADTMQLRSFIGNSELWEDPEPQVPKDWAWTEQRLRRWIPNLGTPSMVREQRCQNAIPRAEPGHRAKVRTAVEGLPSGLDWLSNARFGPGVRDVIEGLEDWLGQGSKR